mgnify:CR=1 FL=1
MNTKQEYIASSRTLYKAALSLMERKTYLELLGEDEYRKLWGDLDNACHRLELASEDFEIIDKLAQAPKFPTPDWCISPEDTDRVKIYKIELLIVDHDNVGAEEICSILENANYPNDCISPQIMKVLESEVDWHDDHALNQGDESKEEYKRIFSNHAIIREIKV